MFISFSSFSALNRDLWVKNMRILVAEDDTVVRSFVEYALKKDRHEVVAAKDGLDALARAEETHPDLIITDTFMPEKCGPDWVAEYAQQNGNPQPKVILMSGKARHLILERFPDAERYDFLSKPFTYSELQQAVSEACKQTS